MVIIMIIKGFPAHDEPVCIVDPKLLEEIAG